MKGKKDDGKKQLINKGEGMYSNLKHWNTYFYIYEL
jgi:hypothetical protein